MGAWCVQPRLFSFVSPLCLSSCKAHSCVQLMKSKGNDEYIWSWRARVPSSGLGGYIWLLSTGVQATNLLNVFNDCTFCFKGLFRRNIQKSFKLRWCNFLTLNSLICWENLLICEKWVIIKLYEDHLGWQQCWDCLFLSTQIRQVYTIVEPEVMEQLWEGFSFLNSGQYWFSFRDWLAAIFDQGNFDHWLNNVFKNLLNIWPL